MWHYLGLGFLVDILSRYDSGIIVAIRYKIEFLAKTWQNLKLLYALLPLDLFFVSEFRFSIIISPRAVHSLARTLLRVGA